MGISAEREQSRRSFLGKLVGGSVLVGAGSLLAAAAAYLVPPAAVRSALGGSRIRVGDAEEIPLGQGRLVLVHDDPVWIVHLARGFAAISALCTHKGCVVRWDDVSRVFHCPCHEGLFDEEGNVLAGLPRSPLPRYQVALAAGEVFVVAKGPGES